ncbi:MAG: hypothetical protein IKG58_04200 [Bacilli bacterium]|nr:hypothetical protein [Bacilli bacterium]
MELEVKDSVVLDNGNEYVISGKTEYEGQTYYFLISLLDESDIKFCYREEDELVEVMDKDFVNKLLVSFYKSYKEDDDE